MGRPIQAIEDRAIRGALRELQAQVSELRGRASIENVRIIANPADEIPVFVSVGFPSATSLPNRLVIEDRTATSKNPRLLLSRADKTTGVMAWLPVAAND